MDPKPVLMNHNSNSLPPATIHVDLDGASAIYAIHGWYFPHERDTLFESGLLNTLEILDSMDLKATMFVIAQDLQDARKRELIEEAVKQGHEIASHSLTHRRLPALGRDEQRREIFESRERISKVLGVDVIGFRAPYFDIDQRMLELMVAAGYVYDSSIVANHRVAHKLGVGRLRGVYYYRFNNCHLLELPLPSYGSLPFPFHPSYSLVLGTWYFRTGLRRFRQTDMPFVLLFHLTDMADPLPVDWLQSWQERFFTLSYMSNERKRQQCDLIIRAVKREYQLIDTKRLLALQRNL